MNRIKKVVGASSQSVNILSSTTGQSQQATRGFNNFHQGGKNQGGSEGKWWRTAGTVTAASAALLAYKVSQERERYKSD